MSWPSAPGAAFRRDPPRVVGEEIAMIGLGVGVVVAVRGRHEGDVRVQKIAGVVASGRVHGPQEHANAQQVEGVVPGSAGQ